MAVEKTFSWMLPWLGNLPDLTDEQLQTLVKIFLLRRWQSPVLPNFSIYLSTAKVLSLLQHMEAAHEHQKLQEHQEQQVLHKIST